MINVRNIIDECKSTTRQDIAMTSCNITKLENEYSEGLIISDEYNHNRLLLNNKLSQLKSELELLNKGVETDYVREKKKEKEAKILYKQQVSKNKKQETIKNKQQLDKQLDKFYKKEKLISSEYRSHANNVNSQKKYYKRRLCEINNKGYMRRLEQMTNNKAIIINGIYFFGEKDSYNNDIIVSNKDKNIIYTENKKTIHYHNGNKVEYNRNNPLFYCII